MECGLCYEEFKPTDEVFNCQKMHVFHIKCYEESSEADLVGVGDIEEDRNDDIFKMRNLCPTCNAPMNITTEDSLR